MQSIKAQGNLNITIVLDKQKGSKTKAQNALLPELKSVTKISKKLRSDKKINKSLKKGKLPYI